MPTLIRAVIGMVILLALLPQGAFAAGCWCDPRVPGQFQCYDDWVVRETVTGFNHVVCNGAPPGTGGAIYTAPHICPELNTVLIGET